MSTSLMMMDTGVHRRTGTVNNSATGEAKSTLNVSNVPINFAMKLLASSAAGHTNTLQLHRQANGISIAAAAPVATASTPLMSVKLEPRVPSPCTADHHPSGGKSEGTRVPSPCIKDFSFYLSKSGSITTSGQHQLVNGGSMNAIEINKETSLATKRARAVEDNNYLPGQTILFNNTSANSPSPPPLLSNGGGHYYNDQSPPSVNSQFTNGKHGLPLKRDIEDAFGPSSTTAITLAVSSSNTSSLASLPSSTNSPSPPLLLTNGQFDRNAAMILSNSVNGVSSPTSSSFSDFGSTGKEDMSPSNSVNGYVDSLGGDPKKKKGPAPRQQEELCLVCGDRASGYHYNALTCEGCKGFFRRSITKNAVYQCKYGNGCEIDMYMRRKCQECRLKKCLSVGMRPECVVPEYQCAIKREAKRAIKEKDKPNSTTKDGLSPSTPPIIKDEQPPTPVMQPVWTTTPTNGLESVEIVGQKKLLSQEQEDTIKKLVYYQDEFESPSEEDIKKIAPFPLGENEEDNQKRFQHVTEMTILTVQLIVEFSKRVPFFDQLYREDQITLLKACSSEVMMLRSSRKYDIRTDSIVYANNQPYTRDNYSSANISYVADSLFNFCRRMCMLKVDNAEYALLTAIVIFSDRPSLLQPKKVEEIQERYIETLRVYVEMHRSPYQCHFAKLLGILTELRTLGNINSEMCVSLKVQNRKLPPFLAEIWDIQE